ncbi:MAG TPA: hypothetical protein PKJ99_03905 [Thermoanaerobaculales bacterium]|nr:hypothetical protein [Thermoanaerobaculales bacterium]HPA81577.1 hypothetical protein [Thermoanaerobaculales bacterium]HQL30113.1 hypothetical protein [Thermoanaerobaculales bacterium]HQN94798.1 hypothetical protein [Thermoanaerobaculales bacterium]HQP43164.1 hypothetical protein [Thermoanaerobaculales bacterium]
MGEKTTTGKADRPKRPIEILRDRLGGVSKELQASVKEQGRIRKLLRGALAGGPRTVPELGAECELPTTTVLWHLMAMRRYGQVVEAGEAGDYVRYALKGSE